MSFSDKKHEDRQNERDVSVFEMQLMSPTLLVENPQYLAAPESQELYQNGMIPVNTIEFISELGEGAFGKVYLGIMKDTERKSVYVAIKTMKSLGIEAQREIKREAEMMNKLKHDKIITFFGLSQENGTLFMLFEYMELGDLNHYLRLHNDEVTLSVENTSPEGPLTTKDCLFVSVQVASGMEYLASKHYVHRDLATRNCLVANDLNVKIGDFGMSRDIYTSDYYEIGDNALLPVRWMPPESILYRRFTIESDIWSFGVLLWEIFTGGKQPWYGYTNQEVITQITSENILPYPEKCPFDIYELMKFCWAKQPQERMTMKDLHNRIKFLLENSDD
ncbi:UNVERIFIED_CONTAM: hypothetical protein RMT77_005321 [Armadillidium vulgare]